MPRVSWSSSGLTGCTASGAWSGTKALSGTLTVSPSNTGSHAYNLSCTSRTGTVSQSVALQVNPFVSLGVSPQSVLPGQPATLTWSSSGATICSASGAWAGTQALSGQATTSPVFTGDYYYALSCTDSMGNTTVATTNPNLYVAPNGYSSTQLVANNSGMAHSSDPALLNPWGIAFPMNHAAVAANNQSNTSTSYDDTGAAQSLLNGMHTLAVQLPTGAGGVPFNPTAVVVAPAGMTVTAAGKSGPAQLIYAGESGMIAAWAWFTIIDYETGPSASRKSPLHP